MTQAALRIIAGKEFSDHLRSRRFHLLFAILAVVAAVGMITERSSTRKTSPTTTRSR